MYDLKARGSQGVKKNAIYATKSCVRIELIYFIFENLPCKYSITK